jgi:general secretion pathway protein G
MIRRTHRDGFTLVELMLVVVIIGVIAAIVVPRLAGRTERAKLAAARQNIASISATLDTFELDVGRFPNTDEGLLALIERPPALAPEDEWNGPYLREVPLDPWNREFIYKYPGEMSVDFDLISTGRDGEEGTEDDVTNVRRDRTK